MTAMPSSVAVSTAMLSTPTPKRPTAMHLSAARRTLGVTWAKQVMMASTSDAMETSVSSLPSGATMASAPASSISTVVSGSVVGQTWSVIRTFKGIAALLARGGLIGG